MCFVLFRFAGTRASLSAEQLYGGKDIQNHQVKQGISVAEVCEQASAAFAMDEFVADLVSLEEVPSVKEKIDATTLQRGWHPLFYRK